MPHSNQEYEWVAANCQGEEEIITFIVDSCYENWDNLWRRRQRARGQSYLPCVVHELKTSRLWFYASLMKNDSLLNGLLRNCLLNLFQSTLLRDNSSWRTTHIYLEATIKWWRTPLRKPALRLVGRKLRSSVDPLSLTTQPTDVPWAASRLITLDWRVHQIIDSLS